MCMRITCMQIRVVARICANVRPVYSLLIIAKNEFRRCRACPLTRVLFLSTRGTSAELEMDKILKQNREEQKEMNALQRKTSLLYESRGDGIPYVAKIKALADGLREYARPSNRKTRQRGNPLRMLKGLFNYFHFSFIYPGSRARCGSGPSGGCGLHCPLTEMGKILRRATCKRRTNDGNHRGENERSRTIVTR